MVAQLLVAASLLAGSAQAETRWLEAASNDFMIVYIDNQTIRQESRGTGVTVWERRVYSAPQQTSRRRPYTEALVQQTYDCGGRTVTLRGWVFRNRDEVVETTTLPTYEQEADQIPPESIVEGIFEFVCGRR